MTIISAFVNGISSDTGIGKLSNLSTAAVAKRLLFSCQANKMEISVATQMNFARPGQNNPGESESDVRVSVAAPTMDKQ